MSARSCRWFVNRASCSSTSHEPTTVHGPAAPAGVATRHDPLDAGRSTMPANCDVFARSPRRSARQRAPGPENDILKRGAMLHADIAILTPPASGPRSNSPPWAGWLTACSRTTVSRSGCEVTVNHWNMGRRLLDRVRPVDTKNGAQDRTESGGGRGRPAMVCASAART